MSLSFWVLLRGCGSYWGKVLPFSRVLALVITSCASKMKLSKWFQLFRTMSTNVKPSERRVLLWCWRGANVFRSRVLASTQEPAGRQAKRLDADGNTSASSFCCCETRNLPGLAEKA